MVSPRGGAVLAMGSPGELQTVKEFFPILILVLGLGFTTGCATERYYYVPAEATDQRTDRAQKGKAFYSIPSEAPTASVRTLSAGLVHLKPDQGGAKIPALHLRLVVSNQSSSEPFLVDAQEQTVIFPNTVGPVRPLYYQSHPQGESQIKVSSGELKSLDLYFPLPKNEKSASDIPEFDFRWQVKLGERVISETTSFDRVPGPSTPYFYPYSYPYYPYGGWYGGPYYPYYSGWEPPFGVVVSPGIGPAPNKPVIVGH